MVMIREARMTPVVSGWLKGRGLTPYVEVVPPTWYKGVDIVGWDGENKVVAVEMKLSLTKGLICQGMLCKTVSDEVYCVVRSSPRGDGVKRCKQLGLGLITVSNGYASVILKPNRGRHIKCLIEERKAGLISRLKKMNPGGVGGLPTMKGVGPARSVRGRILAYLVKNPGASWDDMYRDIDNHYAHTRSMRISQQSLEETLERDGKLDGTRIFTA